MVGVFFISLGIAFMVNATLGVAPWDVFHLGVERHLPLSLGQVMQLTGVLLIIISYYLGVKPNLGTILNMLLIGIFYDLMVFLGFTYSPSSVGLRLLLLVVGIFLHGMGTAAYISANWGPGPRDSLMVALNQRFGMRIGYVRTGIEIGALGIGFALGGPVGIGTIIFSFSIGFVMEFGLFLTGRFFDLSLSIKTAAKPAAKTGNEAC